MSLFSRIAVMVKQKSADFELSENGHGVTFYGYTKVRKH
jgi:hypothetical protein